MKNTTEDRQEAMFMSELIRYFLEPALDYPL